MEEKNPVDTGLRGGDPWSDLPEGDGALVLSPEGKIMSANLQAERILRRELSCGQSLSLADIVTGPHLSEARVAFKEALEGRLSSANLPAKVALAEGLPVSLFYSVTPLFVTPDRVIGVMFSFRDRHSQSSRKRVDLEFNIEYDTLFENMAEGIFSINTRWRITAFNQRAQDITGFRREEVLGKYCWEIFRSDLCQSDCPLRVTLETGITHVDQDVRIVDKGGRHLSILVNTAVIKNHRRQVIGAVETFRPISQIGLGEAREGLDSLTETEMVGASPAFSKLMRLLPDIARSDATVVLEGESGTGKELLARAIHKESPRAKGPFIPVNCSALAETLLESELFGHVKGAFTGASGNKVGRFELAKGGTIFLDEIGDIKQEIQVKLLRVIEGHFFERVGGTRPIRMDARIIAATNRILMEEVQEGRFREDLFYRLRTVPLRLPPLRERKEDLPLLIDHFIQLYNKKYKKNVRGVDPKVQELIQRHSWPGNIRELGRVLEYAFVFVKGPIITTTHLPPLKEVLSKKIVSESPMEKPAWDDEKVTLQKALQKTGGKRQDAARLLGLSRSSLWRKMRVHKLMDSQKVSSCHPERSEGSCNLLKK